MVAAEKGHEKIVEMLNQNADVNARAKYENTALVLAAHKGRERIVEMPLN